MNYKKLFELKRALVNDNPESSLKNQKDSLSFMDSKKNIISNPNEDLLSYMDAEKNIISNLDVMMDIQKKQILSLRNEMIETRDKKIFKENEYIDVYFVTYVEEFERIKNEDELLSDNAIHNEVEEYFSPDNEYVLPEEIVGYLLENPFRDWRLTNAKMAERLDATIGNFARENEPSDKRDKVIDIMTELKDRYVRIDEAVQKDWFGEEEIEL